MRRVLFGITLTAFVFGASLASAEISLTISGGEVSLSARNATVSPILVEWARVGHTRIVNAERVPGPPLTLELSHMPEQQALEILLRNVGGYLLAMRAVANPAASRYDRILIVPVSSPASPVRPPVQTVNASPTFQPARPALPQPPNAVNDPQQAGPPRTPTFTPFPQAPQPQAGATETAPAPAPAASSAFGSGAVGTRFPGMPTAAPSGSKGTNPGTPQ